jgi:hypothetical protein
MGRIGRFAASALAVAGVLGGVAASAQEHGTRPPQKGTQLAQVCGWFAIYYCSRGYQEAASIAGRYRGFVIDSSDPRLPNFRPGWYCVVEGPAGRAQAMAWAAYARRDGYSTAYAKSSC